MCRFVHSGERTAVMISTSLATDGRFQFVASERTGRPRFQASRCHPKENTALSPIIVNQAISREHFVTPLLSLVTALLFASVEMIYYMLVMISAIIDIHRDWMLRIHWEGFTNSIRRYTSTRPAHT